MRAFIISVHIVQDPELAVKFLGSSGRQFRSHGGDDGDAAPVRVGDTAGAWFGAGPRGQASRYAKKVRPAANVGSDPRFYDNPRTTTSIQLFSI